ncbi:uncharacterized protein LOC115208751 precursor [Zea mays]|uniref:uncharacterized protein LOC115208751 precursor n=1 Tax=Zea mays TaxID=4577 RepID=UPI00114085E1|nr:uncharacterized protein LOC115208751 precursor [Zea mays]
MAHGHPVPACLLLAPFVDAGHVSQLRPWICSAPRHHRAAALDVVLGPLTPTPTSSNSATSWSSHAAGDCCVFPIVVQIVVSLLSLLVLRRRSPLFRPCVIAVVLT